MPGPVYQPLFDEFWSIPLAHVTHEQAFLSPGTWTRPPTVNWIEVICVGGGGGGGAGGQPPTPGFGGGGGGGAVRYGYVPVTDSQPVTVGAGGSGAVGPVNPVTVAGNGGASFVGPTPTPLIRAGGGGAGGSYLLYPQPAPLTPLVNGSAAPPADGGGGGAPALIFPATPANAPVIYTAGYWGGPSTLNRKGGGARSGGGDWPGNGRGFAGYGGGGGTALDPANPNATSNNQYFDGGAFYGGPLNPSTGNGGTNTGGGGSGGGDTTATGGPSPIPSAPVNGGTGGSGIVIIRWKEPY